MATVTQGVLLRLLQAMHTDERVTGEHRSPALQVTAVVPALTASTADSLLCPSNGFLLQLSDGVHSTYIQPSPADADALLSARPHIVGHLVHLDRLRFANPVPRAVGLRLVPSSRSLPCVGNPEPLVVRAAPCARGYVIRPDSSSDAAPPLMPSGSRGALPSDAADASVKRTVLAPRNFPEAAAPPGASAVKRRFSSPAPAPAKQRDPSPAAKGASRAASPSVRGPSRASSPAVRGTSRSSSPAPSKCVVPSLVAAKEENRRAAKEPAIIVPSRYRQPSPAGGRRGAASPAGGGRRGSLSPSSRRLSGEGGSKKKVLVSGISKMTDLSGGSAMKPGRKSWDESAMAVAAAAVGSVKKSKGRVDRDTILRTQEAMSGRLSDATTELSSNDDSSVDERPKPRRKAESTAMKTKTAAPKIILHDAKWTDGSISLGAVSDKLSKIGKEATERRDAAAAAAADALQEALITESVIRNLSKFSELCSLSKTSNPLPTVDCFLAVYEDTLKWKRIAESVATNKADEAAIWEKSTTHWVEAALATELEVLKLVNSATGSIYQKKSSTEKPKAPPSVIEPPRASLSSKRPSAKVVQHRVSPPLPAAAASWSKTPGMNETVELVSTLWSEMHVWFLRFVNEAMDVGFHLFEDQNMAARGKQSGHITLVLSQFKRISDWLDGVGKVAEEEATREGVERLKRKIYQFVISRMGSAFESSVSVSAKS